MNKIVLILVALVFVFNTVPAVALNNDWIGTVNDLWGEGANWSKGHTPQSDELFRIGNTSGSGIYLNINGVGADDSRLGWDINGVSTVSRLRIDRKTLHIYGDLRISQDIGSRAYVTLSDTGAIITDGNLRVGHNGKGYLSLGDSATITCGKSLMLGNNVDSNESIVDQSGGTVSVALTLYIPFYGSNACYNLYGGQVKAADLVMNSEGRLYITDGTLILDGNDVDVIKGYFSQGLIVSDHNVSITYDGIENKTTVIGRSPLGKAYNPSPSDGEDGVDNIPLDVGLNWLPGSFASGHTVYFSDDIMYVDGPEAVAVSVNQSGTSYYPPDALKLGTIYFWRIDEVNDIFSDSPRKGDIWKFTTCGEQLSIPKSDINHDNIVNFGDFARLANAWFTYSGQLEFDYHVDLLSDGYIDNGDVNLFSGDWLWSTPAHILKKNSEYTLWYQDPLVKVFKNCNYIQNEDVDATIKVYAAKNEYEPFQLVLTPQETIGNFQVKFTDLVGPDTIEKENLYYYREEYINIVEPTHPNFSPGLYPDPLVPETSSMLFAGQNTSFWVTVKTPNDISAGTYSGTIELWEGSIKFEEIPLELKIWDFAISNKTTVRTAASLGSPYIGTIEDLYLMDYETDDPIEVMKRYYRNLIEHRVRDYTFGPILPDIDVNVVSINPVEVEISTEAFDNMMTYVTQLGMERISLPGASVMVGDDHKWPDDAMWSFGGTEIRVFTDNSNTSFTQDFENVFRQTYGQICEHLANQGWLDKAVVSILDEPDITDAPTVTAIQNIAALYKDVNSTLTIQITKIPPIEGMDNLIDIWVAASQHIVDDNLTYIQQQRQAGDEVHVYHNFVPIIDFPFMRVRSLPWAIWKYSLDGSLSWYQVANYRQANPWVNPIGGVRDIYGNGILLYPARNENENGPFNSIRWEMLREGLEDYEYLHELRNRTETLELLLEGTCLTPEQRARCQLLVDGSYELLDQVDTIIQGLAYVNSKDPITRELDNYELDQPYSLDITVWRALRVKIAEQIEQCADVF